MNKKLWLGILAVVIVLALWAVGGYNGLVKASAAVDGQWAQIDAVLQRRYDLIPNVVASVKGNTQQEKDVFGAIADARSRYAGSTTISDKAAAAGQVESALGRLLVIAEQYPDLKSSQAFRDLNVSLEGTENRISVERQRFNDAVREYNVMTKTFPRSVLAGLFGFDDKQYFEAKPEANEVPKVDFAK